MRILLICGDRRVADAMTKTLAASGIEAIDIDAAPPAMPRLGANADALVIWSRPLRRMKHQAPAQIAQWARHMPLIMALEPHEMGSLGDTAHLINGIVFPKINLHRLATIIHVARAGYLLLPGTIDRHALTRSILPPVTRTGITATEKQLLAALAEGLTNRQIAQRLRLSETAIKRLVHEALRKLHLDNRTQIAIYARFDRAN